MIFTIHLRRKVNGQLAHQGFYGNHNLCRDRLIYCGIHGNDSVFHMSKLIPPSPLNRLHLGKDSLKHCTVGLNVSRDIIKPSS
jgi:hypothetical protein